MEADAQAQKRFGSAMFWRMFAAVNFVAVLWVVWLIWQLTPRPVVNEFVLRLPPPAVHRSISGTLPPPEAPTGAATVLPVAPPVRVQEIPIQSGPPMPPLKLETEIKTPRK